MSFYPTSYYNTGTGITNIAATDVSAATVEASTAFSGPGTGLTGTATSLTAGLAQNLTGSPAVSVSSLTSTGSVGVGTTATSSALNVGTGLTTNLGNGLSTQYDTTTATAATITGGYNTGSGPTPNTPTTGEYQWTIGSTTTYGDMVSLGLYPPGATFTWSFTARGTSAGFTVQTVSNSVTVFTSPALTSTYQTFTWTATIPSNGNGNIYFVVYGASGQNIIWNAFSATRLDTIVTGYLGLGTTNPLANFHIYNPLVSAARVEAPSASGVNPQYQLYASGSQVSLWGYSWNGSYTYFQTNQTQDSMRFYNGAGGAIALQPVSGSVGINTTSPQYTLDVNGTTRISSYVTLPAQPSWSIYFISSLVSSATETNAFTSFNSAATARDVTISSGTVTINTPGRYSVTLTGQVYNDGKVRMYFGRSLGTVLVYNSVVTNSGSAGIASTYIVDCIATQTIYVTLVQNNGTYPLVGYNWSFSGQMIG